MQWVASLVRVCTGKSSAIKSSVTLGHPLELPGILGR